MSRGERYSSSLARSPCWLLSDRCVGRPSRKTCCTHCSRTRLADWPLLQSQLASSALRCGELCRALLDADRCGSDLKGLARRGVFFILGLFYVALAGIPATMLLGTRPSSDQAVRDW